jgi:hypothetical protein
VLALVEAAGGVDADAPLETGDLRELPQAGADLLRASLARVVPGGPSVEVVARPVAMDGNLEVRVLAPDGTPEPDALVVVHTGNGLRNALGRTDTDGSVSFRGLPRWSCQVSITQRAYEGVRRLWRPFLVNDVLPGGAPLEVRFTEVAALRGRVVDAAGKPVAGAWCAAMDGLNFAACFPSDGEGRFDVCSNVPAGTRLQVCARWPMESPRQRGVVEKVIAGEGEITIVIAELGDGAAR